MAAILASIIILAMGWVGFMIFIAPVLLVAKTIQISREEKNGQDT